MYAKYVDSKKTVPQAEQVETERIGVDDEDI